MLLFNSPLTSNHICKESLPPETTLYRRESPEMASQEDLYEEAVRTHGAALDRLARVYEADPDRRLDLLQDIHLAIWRSLASFDRRCSLRTWIYRVGHNVATSHVVSDRRMRSRQLLSLDEMDIADPKCNAEESTERHLATDRLMSLIRELRPLDRQLMLLFLEGVHAAEICEITGISAGNVATRIHRVKKVLANRYQGGGRP
jgi:RNA polymerase sigma-70 factor, ECF subfamily